MRVAVLLSALPLSHLTASLVSNGCLDSFGIHFLFVVKTAARAVPLWRVQLVHNLKFSDVFDHRHHRVPSRWKES